MPSFKYKTATERDDIAIIAQDQFKQFIPTKKYKEEIDSLPIPNIAWINGGEYFRLQIFVACMLSQRMVSNFGIGKLFVETFLDERMEHEIIRIRLRIYELTPCAQ